MKADRYERMLAILYEIDQKPGCTLEKLSILLEMDRSTLYRIIKEMQKMNMPIHMSQAKGQPTSTKTLSINEKYLDRFIQTLVRFSHDETFLLKYLLEKDSLLKTSVLSADIDDLRVKLDRLIFTETQADAHKLHVSNKHARSYEGLEDTIRGLMRAIQDSLPLKARYEHAHKTSVKEFVFEPYTLAEYNGALYVIGRDREADTLHTYSLDRFSSLEPLPEAPAFTVPPSYSPEKYLAGSFGIVDDGIERRYQIKFAAHCMNAIYLRTWGTDQQIEHCPDDSFILSFSSRGLYDIRTWVLGFGQDATVLGPPELRDEIRKEIAAMGKEYE